MNRKILLLIVLASFIQTKAQENIQAGNSIGDTGQVSFIYQNKEVTYKTVRAEDGNEWLQQNLGSEQVATSISDEKSFGDYFQYGRWDDGHQLKTSETTGVYPEPNNPVGLGEGTSLFYIGGGSPWSSDYYGWFANPMQNDDWSARSLQEVTENNGMDPCSAIGENWEIPSEADWDLVFQRERVFPKTDDLTTGIERGFDSHLKIPGSGARKDDKWSFVGQRAYLWTKTASKNPNFYRYVYLGASTYSTTGFGGDSKSYGYGVRCVNKSNNSLSTGDLSKNKLKIQAVVDHNELRIVTDAKIQGVDVFNLNGQLILKTAKDKIDIAHLKPGVYIISVYTVNGLQNNLKIIKK